MSCNFSTILPAKWILAGEHSVLRQHPSLIYPLPYYQFSLAYEKTISPWQVAVHGIYQSEIHALFFSILEHALSLSNAPPIDKTGSFIINNSIPLGSGLGASAAFCLAMSRWLASQNLIAATDIYLHAKQLENLFHGQSSGIDIVGVGANTGRYFYAGKHEPITQTWQPHWYLSSSKMLSNTSHCVEKVNALWRSDPALALLIDEQMTNSVQLALQALQTTQDGIRKLSEAINLAQTCFKQWGLVGSNLQHHIDELTKAGAIACKPTGSGGGGYVLSLWIEPAPAVSWTMIPLEFETLHIKTEPTNEDAHND